MGVDLRSEEIKCSLCGGFADFNCDSCDTPICDNCTHPTESQRRQETIGNCCGETDKEMRGDIAYAHYDVGKYEKPM